MKGAGELEIPLAALEVRLGLVAGDEQLHEHLGRAEELVARLRLPDGVEEGLVVVRREGGVHLEEGGPGGGAARDAFAGRLGVGEVVGVPGGVRAGLHVAPVEGGFVIEHPVYDWVLAVAGIPALHTGDKCRGGFEDHCDALVWFERGFA